MADFNIAITKILRYEGGYVNDGNDYGGETNFGISKRRYPHLDIKSLTVDQAKEIYRRDYWDRLSLDQFRSQAVAGEMLDIAVNMGWCRAARFLQEALNDLVDAGLTVDGLVGPKTVEAANGYRYSQALVTVLNGKQFMHYQQRISEDPTQKKFYRAWLSRVEFEKGA